MPSTAPGFVVVNVEPVNDDALADILQATIVGVVGRVPASLVRPRWQHEVPNQPDFDTNWIAFGVVHEEPDVYSADTEVALTGDVIGGPDSAMTVYRTTRINVLVSFYGPQAAANEARLRAGLSIEQNRQPWLDEGIGVVEVQGPNAVPALLKTTWVRRIDCMLILNRGTSHSYGIASVLGMPATTLDNEHYKTELNPSTGGLVP